MATTTLRNGIDVDQLVATIGAIEDDANIASFTFRASSTWEDGTLNTGKIHGFTHAGSEDTSRDQPFELAPGTVYSHLRRGRQAFERALWDYAEASELMSTPTACREAIRRLWDYVDGELSTDQPQAVEDHLAFRLRCCGKPEFSRELRQMLDGTGQPLMPDGVQSRLENLLDDVLPDLPVTLDAITNRFDPTTNGTDTHAHDREATT